MNFMQNKPAQNRIYFEGAEYFVTMNTQNRLKYFAEPILYWITRPKKRLANRFFGSQKEIKSIKRQ